MKHPLRLAFLVVIAALAGALAGVLIAGAAKFVVAATVIVALAFFFGFLMEPEATIDIASTCVGLLYSLGAMLIHALGALVAKVGSDEP